MGHSRKQQHVVQREHKSELMEGQCRGLESQKGAKTGKVFLPRLSLDGGGAPFQYFLIDVTAPGLHYTNGTLEIHILIKIF